MALLQGFFKPLHPEKYKGDVKNIVYRSSYELSYLRKLDLDDRVLQYSSEEVVIPYRDPTNPAKIRRYFMDFYVKRLDVNNQIVEELVEIKPYSQTKAPVQSSKKSKKTMINEAITYAINQAKWDAARTFCKKKGWYFRVVTEKELGIKF